MPVNDSGPKNIAVVPGCPVNIIQPFKLAGKPFLKSLSNIFKIFCSFFNFVLNLFNDSFHVLLECFAVGLIGDPLLGVSNAFPENILLRSLLEVPFDESLSSINKRRLASLRPPGEDGVIDGLGVSLGLAL